MEETASGSDTEAAMPGIGPDTISAQLRATAYPSVDTAGSGVLGVSPWKAGLARYGERLGAAAVSGEYEVERALVAVETGTSTSVLGVRETGVLVAVAEASAARTAAAVPVELDDRNNAHEVETLSNDVRARKKARRQQLRRAQQALLSPSAA